MVPTQGDAPTIAFGTRHITRHRADGLDDAATDLIGKDGLPG